MTVSNPVGAGGGGKLRWVAREGFPEVTPEVRWMKWGCELQLSGAKWMGQSEWQVETHVPWDRNEVAVLEGRKEGQCGWRLVNMEKSWRGQGQRGERFPTTQDLVCCGEEFGVILNAMTRWMRNLIKGVISVTNHHGCLSRMEYRGAKGGAKRRAQRLWHRSRWQIAQIAVDIREVGRSGWMEKYISVRMGWLVLNIRRQVWGNQGALLGLGFERLDEWFCCSWGHISGSFGTWVAEESSQFSYNK